MDNPVYLYVLMRQDMDSLRNSIGRCAAQANHAGTAHLHYMRHLSLDKDLLNEWQEETMQGFGTTIVLAVNEDQMHTLHKEAVSKGIPTQIVNDPEFGIRDGLVTHFISVDTCAWIFGRRDTLKPLLGHLELY